MTWIDRLLGRIPCLRRRVLVNLHEPDASSRDDVAIEGVLWQHRGQWLVLRNARLKVGARPAVALDGEIVIECAKVAFTQVLGS